MARDPRPTDKVSDRVKAAVEFKTAGEAGLVQVAGLVDEHFAGFGAIAPTAKSLVINVSGMTRMTSFGVRQWLKAMDAIPKSVTELYLLGCPTFFVDQLNMVLNFGGAGSVLTVIAPYTCPSCGMESGETVDVLTERSTLAKGGVPEKDCSRCGGKLEFDETPESYFSFVSKYAASSISPAAAQLLQSLGLYTAVNTTGDKPPRIIKLVHGPVTYFRIIGTIGAMFRARPFLVGAEGEVVLDLADVDRFDPAGLREWKRLLKSLSAQVPAVTLVDVTDSLLTTTPESLAIARNIAAATVLVPYQCADCGKITAESHDLENASWPLQLPEQVCSVCGGTTQSTLLTEVLAPLQRASTHIPPASSKLVQNRKEVLSRALTDASVAQAGEGALSLGADDTILGKYKIVKRLSSGGMAEVFLAKQVGIGGFEKPVALKRILRQLLESRHLAVDMFLNEAKIAGRLMHPNIVQVLDVGEEKGALFLAMEYVRGKDLRELLKKLRATSATIPLGDACFILREVAQALHHAYWSTDLTGKQLAVVHRDVSPHNVILGFDGTVKLLDFGVAMSSVTEHGEPMVAGKWAYMSPEHTLNQAVDHRADLFSLGVMMYLMCTGSMPFAAKEPREIVKKIRAGAFKPIEEVAPQVPPRLAALVSRMLASKPEDRPQTGQEVVTEITELTQASGIAMSSTTTIAELMTRLFGSEQESSLRDIVQLDVSTTKKMAIGSGPTQAQGDADSDPSSRSYRTPTGGLPVNVSVSLARRDFAGRASQQLPAQQQQPLPSPAPAPTMPQAPSADSSRIGRILLIAALVLSLALGLYWFVLK